LTEITCDIFACVVGVWQREFLDLWCVCLVRRTRHTHHRSKKSRCQTPTTHAKISQVISVKHVQCSLRMDHKGSETCRSFGLSF